MTVIKQLMLVLLKDFYNCLTFFGEKNLNEYIIYYNFSFLIEKSVWDLSSLLHDLIAFVFIFIVKQSS